MALVQVPNRHEKLLPLQADNSRVRTRPTLTTSEAVRVLGWPTVKPPRCSYRVYWTVHAAAAVDQGLGRGFVARRTLCRKGGRR